MTTKRVRSVSATLALGGALALSGCTGLDVVGDNQSPFVMVISDISASGADIMLSDVSKTVNDDATVDVALFRKNPNVAITGPLEGVQLLRYEVVFTRSDGRNVEGVDVPFRFTGPLNGVFVDPPGGSSVATRSVIVSVVRHQAKIEPPLRNLLGVFVANQEPGTAPTISGAGIVTTVAEVTVHAATLSGEGLVASARFQVTFADFVD